MQKPVGCTGDFESLQELFDRIIVFPVEAGQAHIQQPSNNGTISKEHTDHKVVVPAASKPSFPRGKPGPNRVEEHRRFARHAQEVFGDDLPTLPPKLYLRFVMAIDADPEIIPPPGYPSFAAYLAPRVPEASTLKGKLMARKSRETEFRRLIKNRLKSLPAGELAALIGPIGDAED